MLGGRLFAPSAATIIDVQIGNANDPIVPPGQRGAIVGDYAIWVHTGPPSSGWALLSGALTLVYGKLLTAADLGLNGKPSQSWGLSIYRDATAAAARPAGGFAKSPAHVGVVAVFANASIAAPARLTSPDAAATRLLGNSAPYFALYDVVAPTDYADGSPIGNGDPAFFAAFELLRS